MRVLFLSQRVPYPPNRGDKITTWRLVERIRRRHELVVVAFSHGPPDEAGASELRAMGIEVCAIPHRRRRKKLAALPLLFTGRPLTLGVYGSRRLRAEVDRLAGGVDAAYAYSSSMGAFLLGRPFPWVMHFGELDSDKWRQYAERMRPPASWVYGREHRTLLEFERALARESFENVLCTPLEEHIFREQIPGVPTLVLRNGVDLEHFHPKPELADPGHLVFTGVMNYHPNVDACTWFARKILPAVRERVPRARFSIVGAHPTAEVRRLQELPGVTVTGRVPETVEWLQRSSVAVAPLRIARGIQNKVLEAMACGLAVVGTTPATQGVGGVDGRDYRVADDAPAFARAVVDLLERPEERSALGMRARRFVEQHYDWEQVFLPLDELLERLEQAARNPTSRATP